MAIKGVLFDKDGTLLDYFETWMPVNRELSLAVADGDEALAQRLLVAIGYDPKEGHVRSGSVLAAGNPDEFAAAWLPHLPGRSMAELATMINEIFIEGGRRYAVAVVGLDNVIAGLKARGLCLGVATSDSAAGARASLSHFDVLDHLDFLAGFDSGYPPKPDPGLVLGFCAATGLATDEVAMVGDNLHDLAMGRAARAGLVVGVLTGTSGRGDLEHHADHVLDSIVELEGLLERLS